jgi:hypothetical protein
MATILKNPGPIEFEGKIQETQMHNNTATWIDFPHDLKETYGKGNLVPVKITFDRRVKYTGSLAKMGGEHAMILLRKDIQEQLGKGTGESVKVTVELDTRERKVDLAKDSEAALKEAGLLEKFKSMAFTHQREYHQWIEEAKRPETRANRIARTVEMLKAGQKEPR